MQNYRSVDNSDNQVACNISVMRVGFRPPRDRAT